MCQPDHDFYLFGDGLEDYAAARECLFGGKSEVSKSLERQHEKLGVADICLLKP
jgi:hypothetical protein